MLIDVEFEALAFPFSQKNNRFTATLRSSLPTRRHIEPEYNNINNNDENYNNKNMNNNNSFYLGKGGQSWVNTIIILLLIQTHQNISND